MLLARPLLLALCAVAMLALTVGCGSDGSGSGYGSGDSTEEAPTATATTPEAPPGASARSCKVAVAGARELRATGIGCEDARIVAAEWAGQPSCAAPAGASRFSCTVEGGYRCSGASTDRGIAVSCARSGASVAFVAGRK